MLKRLNNVTNRIKNRNISNSCESYINSIVYSLEDDNPTSEETKSEGGEVKPEQVKAKKNIFIRFFTAIGRAIKKFFMFFVNGIKRFVNWISGKKNNSNNDESDKNPKENNHEKTNENEIRKRIFERLQPIFDKYFNGDQVLLIPKLDSLDERSIDGINKYTKDFSDQVNKFFNDYNYGQIHDFKRDVVDRFNVIGHFDDNIINRHISHGSRMRQITNSSSNSDDEKGGIKIAQVFISSEPTHLNKYDSIKIKEIFNKHFNLDNCSAFSSKVQELVKKFKNTSDILLDIADKFVKFLSQEGQEKLHADDIWDNYVHFIRDIENGMRKLTDVNLFYEKNIAKITVYLMEVYKAGEDLKLFDK
jgi:hypothetical protein